ncbi:ERF family protein [Dyadobacter bucti]|uniref:ERF family protein n=1 Tax=Dyadobacter bucti TaxID=2572203 RepID=UPI001108FF41|nr:ERF family protein [Dyadobacter bucti]
MTEVKYPETLEMAMLAVQSELTNPLKTAAANYGKYATLPEIRDLVTPILAKVGLYIIQNVDFDEIRPFLLTGIVHAPTQKILSSRMPLVLDKQTAQGMGSAITYARRYALCAMLNIAADEDDDGQAAEKPKANKPAPKPEPVSPERLAAIIQYINDSKDNETVKKLHASAKEECMKAEDEKSYNQITETANKKLKQLKGE